MMKLVMPLLVALLPVTASGVTPPGSTAEAQVNGSVADVAAHTQAVFKKMGISPTGSSVEESGGKQKLEGRRGDLNVEVDLGKVEKVPHQTMVEVTAKKAGALTWNNDYAKKVLENIIATS